PAGAPCAGPWFALKNAGSPGQAIRSVPPYLGCSAQPRLVHSTITTSTLHHTSQRVFIWASFSTLQTTLADHSLAPSFPCPGVGATSRPPLLCQPRRFEVQMQFIDKRVPLDVDPHRMEERGVGEAGQVELVGQVALQPLDGPRVRRRIRCRAPLLEQLIH